MILFLRYDSNFVLSSLPPWAAFSWIVCTCLFFFHLWALFIFPAHSIYCCFSHFVWSVPCELLIIMSTHFVLALMCHCYFFPFYSSLFIYYFLILVLSCLPIILLFILGSLMCTGCLVIYLLYCYALFIYVLLCL